jgi:hypothetical protein
MNEPRNIGRRTFPKESLWNIVGGTLEALQNTLKSNIKSGFRVTGIWPLDEKRLLSRELK